MLEENKIQDIFKQTSLEKEDWLEPSPMVFKNIEGAIYKNKRKRWFWLCLIPIFSALVFYAFLQVYNNKLSENSKNEATSSQVLNEQTAIQKSTTKLIEQNKKATELDAERKVSAEIVDTIKVDTSTKNSISKTSNSLITKIEKELKGKESLKKDSSSLSNNILKKPASQLNREKRPSKYDASLSLKKNISTLNTVDESLIKDSIILKSNILKKPANQLSKEKRPSKYNASLSLKKNISTLNTVDESLSINARTLNKPNKETSNSILNKATLVEKANTPLLLNELVKNETPTFSQSKNLTVNKSIEKLQAILPGFISNKNELNIISSSDNIIADLVNRPKTDWSINVVSGLSYWVYTLNNNYKRALESADFRYNNSTGYFILLEAKKELNKKFSIIGGVGFETVFNKSGHNSTISYNPANENKDDISTYDLKMASPLGFIDANVEVLRQNDVKLVETPFIINLNNQHKISSIDLSTYLSAKIFNLNNANASVRFGLGVAQIINIKNELTSFSTSLPALTPHTSEIIANQNELNKTRPFLAFGGNFDFKINGTNKLFINYSFKSDFNALYQSGELCTFLNKHNVGLGYQKCF